MLHGVAAIRERDQPAARRSERSPPEAPPGRNVVQVGGDRLPGVIDQGRRTRGRKELVHRRHAGHHRAGQGRVGQSDAVAQEQCLEGMDAAAVRNRDQDQVADPTRARPRHRRAGVGLRGAVAQVVARDQAAHAVADDVEARPRVAPRVRQRLEGLVQPPRRLHEVAPPVVGKDVLGHPAGARRARGTEADGGQQLEQVVVLGEPEEARDELVGAEERARHEVVLARREGQHERQRQLVLPDGVADVQPDAPAVRTQEARPHDAGKHDHGRNAVAARRWCTEEPRIEPPPLRAGLGEGERRSARADAGEERLHPSAAPRALIFVLRRTAVAGPRA